MENFLKNFNIPQGGNNPQMSKVNEIWSMLDDLSKKDPKAYNSFIKNNLSKGKKMMEEKEKKLIEEKFLKFPDFLFCVKLNTNIDNLKNKDLNDSQKKLFFLDNNDDKKKIKEINEKYIFYVNFFKDDKTIKPNKEFVKNLKDQKNERKVLNNSLPFFFSKPELIKKKNKKKVYFNFFFNPSFLNDFLKDPANKNILIEYTFGILQGLINRDLFFMENKNEVGIINLNYIWKSAQIKNFFVCKNGKNIFNFKFKINSKYNHNLKDVNDNKKNEKPDVNLFSKIKNFSQTGNNVKKENEDNNIKNKKDSKKKNLISEVKNKKKPKIEIISSNENIFKDILFDFDKKKEISFLFIESFEFDSKKFDIEADLNYIMINYEKKNIYKKKLDFEFDVNTVKAKFYRKKKKLKLIFK